MQALAQSVPHRCTSYQEHKCISNAHVMRCSACGASYIDSPGRVLYTSKNACASSASVSQGAEANSKQSGQPLRQCKGLQSGAR